MTRRGPDRQASRSDADEYACETDGVIVPWTVSIVHPVFHGVIESAYRATDLECAERSFDGDEENAERDAPTAGYAPGGGDDAPSANVDDASAVGAPWVLVTN